MESIVETYSVIKFKALLDKVLAGLVMSLLRGSDWYNLGKLVNESLGNSVLQVEENIVGNIEVNTLPLPVTTS